MRLGMRQMYGLFCFGSSMLLLFGSTGCATQQTPAVGAVQKTIQYKIDSGAAGRARMSNAIDPVVGMAQWLHAKDGGQATAAFKTNMPALLLTTIEAVKGSDDKTLEFFFVRHAAAATPPAYHRKGHVAFQNGEVLFVDIGKASAAEVTRLLAAGKLQAVKSVRLSGKALLDRRVLSELVGKGTVIQSAGPLSDGVVGDIALVEPRALIVPDLKLLAPILPRLKQLQHLILTAADCGQLDSLRQASALVDLAIECKKGTVPSAGALAAVSGLRGLQITSETIRSFTSLQEATGLRTLSLRFADVPQTLAGLSELPHLHTLIMSFKKAEDYPGLDKLTQLRVLGLLKLPKGEGALVRVSRLKKLEILIVPKDDLKRRAEDLALLKGLIPGLQLRGFCLGSRHVLLVLALGLLLGVLLRCRRRRRAAGDAT